VTGRSRLQRPRIPFRTVNRRGTPGHDPEMQRHHLLPRQLLCQPGFALMLDSLDRRRVGFDDFRANGMLLPAMEECAMRLSMPLHRGPHREYNDMVMERVGQIEGGWSTARRRCSDRAGEEALMRLALLQSALRRRLLEVVGKRIVLNRRDPNGAVVDYSDLDAMAESLWGVTSRLAGDPWRDFGTPHLLFAHKV
jgi:hypothetical protein